MAMLEAFVHDPLINWRLLTPAINVPSDVEDDGESTSSRGFPFEEMVSGERKDGDMDESRVSGPASIARSSRPRGADQLGTSIHAARGNWEREVFSTLGMFPLMLNHASCWAEALYTDNILSFFC